MRSLIAKSVRLGPKLHRTALFWCGITIVLVTVYVMIRVSPEVFKTLRCWALQRQIENECHMHVDFATKGIPKVDWMIVSIEERNSSEELSHLVALLSSDEKMIPKVTLHFKSGTWT